MSTSTKPYLLRALYEWCADNHYTPHLTVWVDEHVQVPMAYVKNNEIVLNIGANATHKLLIDNEYVSFSARFSGVSHDIWVPVGNVMAIFARETGEGMGFEGNCSIARLRKTPPRRKCWPCSRWPAVRRLRMSRRRARRAVAADGRR